MLHHLAQDRFRARQAAPLVSDVKAQLLPGPHVVGLVSHAFQQVIALVHPGHCLGMLDRKCHH